MLDPINSYEKTFALSNPDGTYYSRSIGVGVALLYKSGGLTATLSGSGRATGKMYTGYRKSVYGAQGIVYTGGQFSYPSSYTVNSFDPYLSQAEFFTRSFTAGLTLTATQNFMIKFFNYLSIAFDANIAGKIAYSFGSNVYGFVRVLSNDAETRAVLSQSNTDRHTDAISSNLNLISGDVVVIRFEYSGFNPMEETAAFYSVLKSGNAHPIMQRNFTSSATGSGIFEASWTVPWDDFLAGEGSDDIRIDVRASNSLFGIYSSDPFKTTIFTEKDGIFLTPRASEIVPIEMPYTLRWTSSLLHYFEPAYWGADLGDDITSSEVEFEIIAEKLFPNATVQSFIHFRNLTVGPVPNTGECVVTFPRSLLSMGDRFYITVKSSENSATSGWSKAYFTLADKQGIRSLENSQLEFSDIGQHNANGSTSLATRHFSTPSNRDPHRHKVLADCSPTQTTLKFEALSGLAARGIEVSFRRYSTAFTDSFWYLFSNPDLYCTAGPLPYPLLPSPAPTRLPTPVPIAPPTYSPTRVPIQSPTLVPSGQPTQLPTLAPSAQPTQLPTLAPSAAPTKLPTRARKAAPTQLPTLAPSVAPTQSPTRARKGAPTQLPARRGAPTQLPTRARRGAPTQLPTRARRAAPTQLPTRVRGALLTQSFTLVPSANPTQSPTPIPPPTNSTAGGSDGVSQTSYVRMGVGLAGVVIVGIAISTYRYKFM